MIHIIRARTVVALLGLALLVAACGTGTPSAAPSAATSTAASEQEAPSATTEPTPSPSVAPTAVTVLNDFLVSGWHAPMYAGVAKGFFADRGLDVTVEPGQGSVDGATKVAAGTADFAQIDSVSAMNAMAKGGDLLLIGVVDQAFPGGLCYLPDRTTIDDFGDLMGLRIGSSEGDAYMVPLPGLIKNAGFDPEGYEHIIMTPANYTAALFTDQIDAYACSRATFIPGQAAAKAEGLTLGMFRYADTGFQPIGHALVANGALVRDNPDLVQRFVDAWAYSHVWAWANPDETMTLFLEANPAIDPDIARAAFLDREKSYAAGDEFFTFNTEKLDATVEFVNEAYDADLTPDDVYDPEFVNALPDAIKQGHLP